MIRNNFLLVLLTFNFSPLLFSPIINTENVLSTGSLVGSKSWLFYKGSCSTFIKRNELTLPKAFKSKALTPFVRIWTLTHVHTSSIIIFQLYVIPISISKSTCRASVCLHWQQPRPTAQKELPCPFALTKNKKQNILECFSQCESFSIQQPRDRNWTDSQCGLISWSGKR